MARSTYSLPARSFTLRAMLLASALWSHNTMAHDTAPLAKRKIPLANSTMTTIAGKVPTDLIVLIGVAMFFACLCLVISVLNVRHSWVGGSRQVLSERHRAQQDLRLRGASSNRSLAERKVRLPHQRESTTSTALSDRDVLRPTSSTRSTVDVFQSAKPQEKGPKLVGDGQSRASRGYSFYTRQEMAALTPISDMPYADRKVPLTVSGPRRPMTNQSPTRGALTLPLLSHVDGGSESSSTTNSSPDPAGSSSRGSGSQSSHTMQGPRPLPSHARPMPTRQYSDMHDGLRRVDSTAAGGHRSFDRGTRRYEMPPRPPTVLEGSSTLYDGNVSPTRGAPANLYRNHSDQGPQRPYGAPPPSLQGYYDLPRSNAPPVSEPHGPMLNRQHPLQQYSGMTRTRPLNQFDADLAYANQLSALLDNSQRTAQPPPFMRQTSRPRAFQGQAGALYGYR